MTTRIKVDEDLPQEVGTYLSTCGFDTATVLDEQVGGLADHELWNIVQRERRWLFTADKGFADLRHYPPGTHAGVVLLRLRRETRKGFLTLVRRLVDRVRLEKLSGATIVVTPEAIRIVRPPRNRS